MSNNIIKTDKATVTQALSDTSLLPWSERCNKEKEIKVSVLKAIVEAVAKELNFKVIPPREESEWYCDISDEDGRKLHFNIDWRKYRLSVLGSSITDAKGNHFDVYEDGKKITPPSITVDAGRSAKLIAGEIKRRVFPDYDVYLRAARERKEDLIDRENKIEAHKQTWELVLGGKVTRSTHTECLHLNNGKIYGEVQVGTDYANIKLNSLSHEQAIKLAEFLVDL